MKMKDKSYESLCRGSGGTGGFPIKTKRLRSRFPPGSPPSPSLFSPASPESSLRFGTNRTVFTLSARAGDTDESVGDSVKKFGYVITDDAVWLLSRFPAVMLPEEEEKEMKFE